MTDHGEAPGTASPIHLLVWCPPARSGRFVVGGWCLESWRGSFCAWRMELAGLGAYFWVDAALAKAVAARVLRGQSVPEQRWVACGSGSALTFMARPDVARRPDPSPFAGSASVLAGRGRSRSEERIGSPVR
jgi:hypothetical protein